MKKQKTSFDIACLIGKILFISSIAVILVVIACIVFQDGQLPDSGTWYCEELQLQWNTQSTDGNYIKVDGDYVCCAMVSMNDEFIFCCQDSNSEHYTMGECVLRGEYVKGDKDSFSIRKRGTEKIYTFVRNDDFQLIPEMRFLYVSSQSYSAAEISKSVSEILIREISNQKTGSNSIYTFCDTELQANRTITYDLYCLTGEYANGAYPHFYEELSVYIEITSVDGVPLSKPHTFGFCVTPEEIKPLIHEESHLTDEHLSAIRPEDKEHLGSFSFNVPSSAEN